MKQTDCSIKHWLCTIKPVPQQLKWQAHCICTVVLVEIVTFSIVKFVISKYLREYSEFCVFYQGDAVSTK